MLFPCVCLRYLGFVLAALALESVVPEVGNGDQPAQVAHMKSAKSSIITIYKSRHVKDEKKVNIKCGPVRIGDFKKPLSQELSSSMRDLAISLHLAEPSINI